ncbi:type II secretion system F family protein [Plantibacter sp. Mn2098]|uniref:type II secretion system F family protein n=1 Tax=Plantibacter sp. Mn2098 TaxID=3395266 RepID=UPI003BC7932A
MSDLSGWALCLGALLGLGLWSLAHLVPPLRTPRLIDRVCPHLVDVSAAARSHARKRTADPLPVLGILLSPGVVRLGRLLSAMFGNPAVLALRLGQAGTPDIGRYRLVQLCCGLVGFVIGAGGTIGGYLAGTLPVALAAVVPIVAAVCGVAVRDQLLQQAARRRIRRVEDELPTILEFLSLSLAAGEAITDAIARVSRIAGGELSGEFRTLTAEVRTGVPFTVALRALDARLSCVPVTRCADQVIGALERGTPVAAVLRSQAQDSREAAKRRLLESAGKKEVAMLVPVKC